MVNVNDHAVFLLLLDYLEHLDYLVRLDLFYESTSSIVCLAIADDHKLAVDDTLADVGIASCNVFNSSSSFAEVQLHWQII